MHEIVMEITLLIMENHGIAFLNFCGNPEYATMSISENKKKKPEMAYG